MSPQLSRQFGIPLYELRFGDLGWSHPGIKLFRKSSIGVVKPKHWFFFFLAKMRITIGRGNTRTIGHWGIKGAANSPLNSIPLSL